jgi:D-amino-acid dehydrogenase
MLVDRAAIRAMEPNLADGFELGLRAEGSGFCRDPFALSKAPAARVFAEGATLLRGEATGFERGLQALRAVKTDRGDIPADVAVIAAGIWSKQLCAALGHRVPLESQRGYHVTVRNPNVTLTNMLGVGSRKVALTPMDGGLRIAGTVEFAGTERLPDHARSKALIPILRSWCRRCGPTTSPNGWATVRAFPTAFPPSARRPISPASMSPSATGIWA